MGALPWMAAAALLAAQDERDLVAELAALVDVPHAAERREAALALAADASVPLADWLAACRALPSRGEVTPGTRIEEVELEAEGRLERTPLAVHVPRAYRPGTPAPLLLVLHWTGGRGEQAIRAWVELAEAHGLLVVAPSETGENDGYRYTQRERDVALGALRWMRRTFDVDPDAVFVTGVSRGGHLAWDLALRHPDRFAGAAPMIGGPSFDLRGGRANLRYLENLLPLTLVDLQGARDQEGLVWNVRYAFERLAELGATRAAYHEFPELGHEFRMDAVDWAAFFAARRDPRPAEVVRRFARPGEGRASWVEVLAGSAEVAEEFAPEITASRLRRLDEPGKRRWLIGETEERTARLWARFVRPGRVEVKARDVARFRLLLAADMLEPDEPLEIKVGSRRRRLEVETDAETLLVEFAERFDPSFLPVAQVELEP